MLELHHALISTCSQKVRWVLAEKQLDWVDHRVRLEREEHLRPEYLRLNPNGVVPTLVHEGEPVIDSSVINEYLDECFDVQPLRPTSALARARMRAWRQTFERMAGALADGPWLVGTQMTLADISILPTVVRLADLGLPMLWQDLPEVARWYRRMQDRPAFEATFVPGSSNLTLH